VPVAPLAPELVTCLDPADAPELLRASLARCAEVTGPVAGPRPRAVADDSLPTRSASASVSATSVLARSGRDGH